MAVPALHPVDVVLAIRRNRTRYPSSPRRGRSSTSWDGRRARGPRLLAVLIVARQAADAFVYADPGTVVAAAHLHCGCRCVALVAQRLPLVPAHADGRAPSTIVGTGSSATGT